MKKNGVKVEYNSKYIIVRAVINLGDENSGHIKIYNQCGS